MTNDRKHTLILYGAFIASLLLSFVPSVAMGVISLLAFIGVMMFAYRLRKGAEPESLTRSHAAFLIRTIWIAGALSVVTITLGSTYMLSQIDYSPFAPCADALAAHAGDAEPSFHEVYAAAQPCMDIFLHYNMGLLVFTALLAAGPIVLYLGVQVARGFQRAFQSLPAPKKFT